MWRQIINLIRSDLRPNTHILPDPLPCTRNSLETTSFPGLPALEIQSKLQSEGAARYIRSRGPLRHSFLRVFGPFQSLQHPRLIDSGNSGAGAKGGPGLEAALSHPISRLSCVAYVTRQTDFIAFSSPILRLKKMDGSRYARSMPRWKQFFLIQFWFFEGTV